MPNFPISGGRLPVVFIRACTHVKLTAAAGILAGRRGDYTLVHPNDHVNQSQSTNDLRLLASGPATGIAETVCCQVLGCDQTMARAAAGGRDRVRLWRGRGGRSARERPG